MSRLRRGAVLWIDAMGRTHWSIVEVNVSDDVNVEYNETRLPDSLSNYVAGDPIYGQPDLDTESLKDLIGGDTPVWVYNVREKLWCIIGNNEVPFIQAGVELIQHNLQLGRIQNSMISDTSAPLSGAALAGKSEVLIEKQGTVRSPTNSGQIRIYDYGSQTQAGSLITISDKGRISAPFRAYDGQINWWSISLIDYYNLAKTSRLQTNPVILTGRAAVIVNTSDGPIWKLARIVSDNFMPNSYAAYFTNCNTSSIFESVPPIAIDGYTIGATNYWVYHISYRLWHEVDQESYVRIQQANISAKIDYIYTTKPTWTKCNKTTVNGEASAGDLEILWNGYPQATPIHSLAVDKATNFAQYHPYLFSSSETITDSLGDLVYMDSAFYAIYRAQVIIEPIISNKVTTWRCNTVEGFQLGRIIRAMDDPVKATGSVALYETTWRLGRNSLNGTGLDKPANFAAIVTNIPSTTGNTNMNNRYFAYHLQHLVLYEVDLDSFLRIRRSNQSTQFALKTNKLIPMVFVNSTSLSGDNELAGNLEVFWERMRSIPPDVTTLKYPDQIVGTVVDGDPITTGPDKPENIFGIADANLTAFKIPGASEVVPIWDYRVNDWRALYLDQLVILPDITEQTYCPTLIKLLLLKGRVLSIDKMAAEVQQAIDQINGFISDAEVSTVNTEAAWQVAGLSQGRVQEIQAASDAAKVALVSLKALNEGFITEFQKIMTLDHVYVSAKQNEDIASITAIYQAIDKLDSTTQGILSKAENWFNFIKQQESIATNGMSLVQRTVSATKTFVNTRVTFGYGIIVNIKNWVTNVIFGIKSKLGFK